MKRSNALINLRIRGTQPFFLRRADNQSTVHPQLSPESIPTMFFFLSGPLVYLSYPKKPTLPLEPLPALTKALRRGTKSFFSVGALCEGECTPRRRAINGIESSPPVRAIPLNELSDSTPWSFFHGHFLQKSSHGPRPFSWENLTQRPSSASSPCLFQQSGFSLQST
jgi:hypothetical protein